MNAAEIKLKIFRQVDLLEKSTLEDFYGMFVNYINGQQDTNDWNSLNSQQKEGIFEAITQIDSRKGLVHDKIVAKYWKKYSNG